MKIIGHDTEEFLKETALLTYLTTIDTEFIEAGVNNNYVVLVQLDISETESIDCLFFYFTSFPKDFPIERGTEILTDHAAMLQNFSIFIHFASCSEGDIEELKKNPTKEARSKIFERTVFE